MRSDCFTSFIKVEITFFILKCVFFRLLLTQTSISEFNQVLFHVNVVTLLC